MTDQLEGQRHELVQRIDSSMNAAILLKRFFQVCPREHWRDKNGCINLANTSANSCSIDLDTEIEKIGDVLPEFGDLITKAYAKPGFLQGTGVDPEEWPAKYVFVRLRRTCRVR